MNNVGFKIASTTFYQYPNWVGTCFKHLVINSVVSNNRFVNGLGSIVMLGNLSIDQGEYRTNGNIILAGNLTNNGILTNSGTLELSVGSNWFYNPHSPTVNPQTISGTGIFRNDLNNPSANLVNFYVFNANANGVTINVPLSITNSFRLNAKVSNGTNILSLGTANSEGNLEYISGSINGLFKRTFINHTANIATFSNNAFFPLGKGNLYMPLWLDPNTLGNTAVTITAEAFDSNTGSASGVSNLSNRHWAYSMTNTVNLSNLILKIDNAPTGINFFLNASSAAGVYQSIVNGVTLKDGNTLYFSTPINATNLTGFLGLGEDNCAQTVYPYNESLEGLATLGTNSFPNCWLKQNGNWASGDAASSGFHNPRTGTKYLVTSKHDEEYIWLPAILLKGNTASNIKFWFVGNGQNGWDGEVVYNTTQSSVGANTLGNPFIRANIFSSTAYQEVNRIFIPTADGIYYFGIKIKAINLNAEMLGFDDFSVENLKVMLNAKAYLSHVSMGEMENYPAMNNPAFPLSDPYATSHFNQKFVHVNNYALAVLPATTLANDNVVDWMFLELREGTAPDVSTVIQTRTALILTNGKIVDMDGVSPVTFGNIVAGNYYIAIRHRNHLGMITANKIALGYSNPSLLDFTNSSIPLAGGISGAMQGGDSNFDGSIDAFDSILFEIQNGLFDDNYFNNADYNLDASIDAFDSITWEINNGKFQEF